MCSNFCPLLYSTAFGGSEVRHAAIITPAEEEEQIDK
jgi:hypothetical protein